MTGIAFLLENLDQKRQSIFQETSQDLDICFGLLELLSAGSGLPYQLRNNREVQTQVMLTPYHLH